MPILKKNKNGFVIPTVTTIITWLSVEKSVIFALVLAFCDKILSTVNTIERWSMYWTDASSPGVCWGIRDKAWKELETPTTAWVNSRVLRASSIENRAKLILIHILDLRNLSLYLQIFLGAGKYALKFHSPSQTSMFTSTARTGKGSNFQWWLYGLQCGSNICRDSREYNRNMFYRS